MKALVHIGMHKTGTSSIQASFAAKSPHGAAYFQPAGPNLNGWSRLMFEEDAFVRQLAALRDADDATIAQRRAAARDQTHKALEAISGDTVILSAERFCYMSPAAVDAFHDWLHRHFDTIELYAYIRDPLGFVRSAFQQRAKTLAILDDFARDFPTYRARFEKFETRFGQEALHYRLFRRADLMGGDVVTDFADWLGLHYDPADIVQENERLSAEALACLVAARKGLGPEGPAEVVRINGSFVTALTRHKGRGWSLSQTAQDRIIEAIGADCDWMDARLPAPLRRTEKPSGIEITEPDDFVPLALAHFPQLRALAMAEAASRHQPHAPLMGKLRLLHLFAGA